tara:strand:- start:8037 stop:8732 length:696 start_codon:yes stop_codon:yes gene_type:complete
MSKKKVLILGNKPYVNLRIDDIIDGFDVIYRFNMAWPGKNNGTKFGKLAMCQHVYLNFVKNPLNKEDAVRKYQHEMEEDFLSDWYDFFIENKGNFDEIYHENEYRWGDWNAMLEQYGSPHRFSKMATSGYSAIFRNLSEGKEVYVMGFTLSDDERRKTAGEKDEVVIAKNQGQTCHSFSEETNILAWLHNNKKIDASLCMLEDTEDVRLKTNTHNTEPSEFILGLLKEVTK